MEYRFLGRTGLMVSELGLGAMTFGREADEKSSHRMLDRFVECGGNFVDTADAYCGGESEAILGRWVQSRPRGDLVIATKAFVPTGPGPNDRGAGRKHLVAALDASLRRLGTDHVDLYQVHVFDPDTPLAETLSTLDSFVTAGKVRYLGASNFAGWQLQKAIDLAGQHGWEPFACLQPLYNLLDRNVEWDLVPLCRNEGLGVIPWSPLRGGWLTGRYRRGMNGPPAASRVAEAGRQGGQERWDEYATDRTWSIIDAVLAIADETGHTPAQVALRWLLQRPGVTAPIVGARTVEQLDDNLGATGWTLPPQLHQRLTDVSQSRLPYPYDMVAAFQRRPLTADRPSSRSS